MDINKDLAYCSLSDDSNSHFNSSNRLSNLSLSSSQRTHSSKNSNHCSQCKKKLRKRKNLRQNAVECNDPFDLLPGSQVTLTPELTNQQNSTAELLLIATTVNDKAAVLATSSTNSCSKKLPLSSSTSTTTSSCNHSQHNHQHNNNNSSSAISHPMKSTLCKQCSATNRRKCTRQDSCGSSNHCSSKSDGSTTANTSGLSSTGQFKRESSIFTRFISTVSKLFDSKPSYKAKSESGGSSSLASVATTVANTNPRHSKNGFRKRAAGIPSLKTTASRRQPNKYDSPQSGAESSECSSHNNCGVSGEGGGESGSPSLVSPPPLSWGEARSPLTSDTGSGSCTQALASMPNGADNNTSNPTWCTSNTTSASNSLMSSRNSSLGTLSASTGVNHNSIFASNHQQTLQPDTRLLELLYHHNPHQHQFFLDYPRKLNRHNPRVFDSLARREVDLTGNPHKSATNNLMVSHGCLLPTQSCPSKSKSLCLRQNLKSQSLLCSSWPPCGYKLYLNDWDEILDQQDNFLYERFDLQSRNQYEFNIPFNDIRLGEIIKSGPRKKIYKGHWHGDVTVFMFENLNHADCSKFWEKVSNFTMIRHENIVLFMGASIDPPYFLMVTSSCHGPSLYEKIHMSREKMRQSAKVSVMRQIAQAVGYLHAKSSQPIIVKRLNSRNIYLEPKVVLSLLDYSHLDQDDIQILEQVDIPAHLVWYTPPEIFALAHPDYKLPISASDCYFTPATDIFSFGTLMYEIHTGRYPYSKSETGKFIQDICSGTRPEIKEIRASDTVKNIIYDCWSHDALARPEFADISRELMKRDAARKRHCSSVPSNLNREPSSTLTSLY